MIAQRAPARAAAIAWFEPFPPTIVASDRAITVSPGRGSAAPRATRSMLQLPTTATRACVTSDPRARASRAVDERKRAGRERERAGGERVEGRAVEPAQARRDPTFERTRPAFGERRRAVERTDDPAHRCAVRVGIPAGR